MINKDLKYIKKNYGENMMKFCRENFPIILETSGILSKIFKNRFPKNKDLYKDITSEKLESEFKEYIYSLVDVEQNTIQDFDIKTRPAELLLKEGYTLIECKTESELNLFKKFYSKNEELCSFRTNRLEKSRVFFILKNNINEIKREDYIKPNREDEYSTSLLCIQFSKNEVHNDVSIVSRYNHSVNNPNATYSNNLEKIAPGLTKAFENTYNLKINNSNNNYDFYLPNYIKTYDNKYHKIIKQIDEIYFCTNNIIVIDNESKKYDTERYLLIEEYLIDLKAKSIRNMLKDKDAIVSAINEFHIDKIEVIKTKTRKEINFIFDNEKTAILEINKNNEMKKITLPKTKLIEDNFCSNFDLIEEINLPKAKRIKNNFSNHNSTIEKINLPEVLDIGYGFANYCENLKEVNLNKAIKINDGFCNTCPNIEIINTPNIEIVGNDYLKTASKIKKAIFLELKIVGNNFLAYNSNLEQAYLPNMKVVGEYFLYSCSNLKELNLQELEITNNMFAIDWPKLKIINTQKLIELDEHQLILKK